MYWVIIGELFAPVCISSLGHYVTFLSSFQNYIYAYIRGFYVLGHDC